METSTQERKVFNLQEYGIRRGLSFGHYKYKEVKPGLDSHRHEETLEICFCMKGQQHYKVGGQLYELNGNDIFVVPPDTMHSTGEFPEDKGELFWIQILLNNSTGKLCNLPKKHSDYLLEALQKKSAVIFNGAFQLKFILEKLVSHFEKWDSIYSEIMADQLIKQLLLETVMLSKKPQQTAPTIKLNQLDNYIQQNLHRIIYVDEMANLSGMSTGYFKAWFKLQTGMPPKEYINRSKIEQGKIDLLKNRAVTKVAFDLGFSSSQYFATTFKKFTGYTPKTYCRLQMEY
ncbi:AraC family transcriptional regulator [Cellulophaga sp. F20128]|uniref:AraC family transcriptional regulator n=1 Tax=Cellulophaga sp. F20128 TaxID=2926413 RepID=UPI001FF5C4EE|nr:AraC family transcriptional regulator [Cellulophaga sp. F20128]MCK0157047.1 AraC family transcriptional regulator [Cellulophaga sp. F20128]